MIGGKTSEASSPERSPERVDLVVERLQLERAHAS
jgi:hypothetical protein